MADDDTVLAAIKQSVKAYDKHAQAVGYVALAWTGLQESLASIFSMLMDLPSDRWMDATEVWYAVDNDRTQRRMLRALAESRFKNMPSDERFVELKWCLDQLDSYENKRNDTLHSPYIPTLGAFGGRDVIPFHMTGHRRAQNLRDKDLPTELESYRANIDALSGHLRQIAALVQGPLDLPRPKLPPRPPLPRPAHAHDQKRREDRQSPKKPSRSSRP
jgi:hypothetical protein